MLIFYFMSTHFFCSFVGVLVRFLIVQHTGMKRLAAIVHTLTWNWFIFVLLCCIRLASGFSGPDSRSVIPDHISNGIPIHIYECAIFKKL